MRLSRAAGVGVFVLGGVALFAVVLFLIGDRRGLFADSFTVYSEFRSLSGLQVGTQVWVSGMGAGELKDIQVPSSPGGRFRLRMEVREALHPLVRVDSTVSIRTEGLVGVRYLQISAGSENVPRLPDGGTLASQEPFDFADLLLQMSETVQIVNATIESLASQVEEAITGVQDAASQASALIDSVAGDVTRMASAGRRIADDTSAILADVKAGKGTLGKVMTDDELYRRIATIAREAQTTAENVRKVSERAREAMESFGGAGGNGTRLSTSLQQTLDQTREAMANLEDATEALKHNFLLRGFFRDRGYFNIADLSEQEYRRGALEQGGRRALRIWLSADVLFEPGGGEEPELTEGGRNRLESALAQFLEYREAGPLVIEGYSTAPDAATRYLRSRARASLVRDYLVRRFDLDPGSVGFLALGNEPVGDPPETPWNGVALALFVERE